MSTCGWVKAFMTIGSACLAAWLLAQGIDGWGWFLGLSFLTMFATCTEDK